MGQDKKKMPGIHHSGVPAFVGLMMILCFSYGTFAAGVVTSAKESSLVAALADGGAVTFAVDGTIYLTTTIVVSNNTVLDGTGHNVVISGSNSVQIFIVNSNTTLAMTNLTLAEGHAEFWSFYESWLDGGHGGAITNAGTLQMTGCVFVDNGADGGTNYSGGAEAEGGAIYNTGLVMAWSCSFVGNYAAGAIGESEAVVGVTSGGVGNGGAIFNANQATFINCVFSNNSATGGQGGSYENSANFGGAPGGGANGGALCNIGSLVASNNTFAQNVATGGQGGQGGAEVVFYYVYSGGGGAKGGTVGGGAVCCLGGSSILVNDTFWSNSAFGGTGGAGGAGSFALPGTGGQDGNGGNGGQGGGGWGRRRRGRGRFCYRNNFRIARFSRRSGDWAGRLCCESWGRCDSQEFNLQSQLFLRH